MTKRKILVLGGTSYFGKYLVDMLLARGDDVSIVTRGNNPVPAGCSYINFDRSKGDVLSLNNYWDVVYDQSCYSSKHLDGLESIIKNSDKYILTSSQAVYQPGLNIEEDSISYDDISIYHNKINDYGFEKLKSELLIHSTTKNAIFPRFPVVVGAVDPRGRLQSLITKVVSGNIDIPMSNPGFQILDSMDAANVLFNLPFLNIQGAINIASREAISAEDICKVISDITGESAKLNYIHTFEFNQFDLIKSETKTLSLEKQEACSLDMKTVNTIVENIYRSMH